MKSTPPRRASNAGMGVAFLNGSSAIEETPQAKQVSERRAAIENAIDSSGSGLLRHWVAIAVWEREDGSTEAELIRDEGSNDLQAKGFMHDAIWKFAHLT